MSRLKPTMTHFVRDILRQPKELQRTIDYLRGDGHRALTSSADAIRESRHVFLTGIGSSWHAALAAGSLFYQGAQPVYMQDAAELLQFSTLPPKPVVIIISRSGRSIEIVKLLAKAGERRATVIGITSSPDGTLAREADISLLIPIQTDHAISVNTYSSLAAAAGALAVAATSSFDSELAGGLSRTVQEAERLITVWQEQLSGSPWLSPGAKYCFLARGSGVASCQETRLLWEEGVKSPASAMGTGSFRHGPQEMVAPGSRFILWIDGQKMREEDLAVARDLRKLGASVMLIGQDLPSDTGDISFQLPATPAGWQFLIDIIPAQFAAEHLARLSGVDADSFRLCSFIVEDESGLLPDRDEIPRR
jgi:glucosamine--fructose-6-phosphate aminotransferase (isomerizing)